MKKHILSRILSVLLASCLALSAAGTARAAVFRDVPDSHWAARDVDAAAARGWVEGVGGGLFVPEGRVTYAGFAAMTARALFPEEIPEAVPGRPWYEPYMETCVKKGVFDGTALDIGVDVDAPMTRAALAVAVANALRIDGAKWPEARELAAVYVPDIGEYTADERAAIRAVYAMGVLRGCDGQGTFAGRDNMTRAQAAAVLIRMSAVEREPSAPQESAPTDDARQRAAYEAILAMKARYPEGTRWTNANSYAWRGGIFNVGYGCMGFAFLLSDAAFGEARAAKVAPVRLEDVRVGDILRINNDTHSVVVLEVREDSVVVAEGNYNSSVHWGRELPRETVERADYLLTRYGA